MEETGNKNILSSVLFLDIVEYSRKSVTEQIALKEGFNAFLSSAIQGVTVDDRIILDTGDGAAINFLGDVADALKVALAMRDKLLHAGANMKPPLLVRMGINLGPVRLVKDGNGLPNIVGDGINVAQRIMEFAATGQVLVSQSYFDTVSHQSQDYAAMFHYQGSRTDKHVREHEVYAIGYPGEFTVTQKNLAVGGKNIWPFGQLLAWLGRLSQTSNGWLLLLSGGYKKASVAQRMAINLAVGLVLILLVVLIGKPSPRPAAPVEPIEAVTERNIIGAQSAVVVSSPTAKAPAQSTDEITRQEQVLQNKVMPKNARVRTLEETSAINSSAPALVRLAVIPWGEVYLDGRMQGVSPPLAELQVLAGEHEIEIRNTTFPVYRQKFKVQADGKIKIKHKF